MQPSRIFSDAPIVMTSSDKVAVDVDQTATFSCHAHSLPETVFTWMNGSQEITDGQWYFLVYTTGKIPNLVTYKSCWRRRRRNCSNSHALSILTICQRILFHFRRQGSNNALVHTRSRIPIRNNVEHLVRQNNGFRWLHVHRQQRPRIQWRHYSVDCEK